MIFLKLANFRSVLEGVEKSHKRKQIVSKDPIAIWKCMYTPLTECFTGLSVPYSGIS